MNRITLRSLIQEDLPLTLAWHNQQDIVDAYSGHPFPVNVEMEKKWYEKILTSNFPITVFGIEVIENQNLICMTVLKDRVSKHDDLKNFTFLTDRLVNVPSSIIN